MKDRIELKAGNTVVFAGDSITDAGRIWPAYEPFGFGYVNFVANNLLARYPTYGLNIVNTGVSGNTIRNLEPRWKMHCLDHKPDVVSVLIGINDLLRRHMGPERACEGVEPDEYESVYRQILSEAVEQCGSQLVLMEPFMFCEDASDQIFMGLADYIEVVRGMAEQFDAVLVPLQSRISEGMKQVPAASWSEDMVHPYVWAHAWISQRWFEATKL